MTLRATCFQCCCCCYIFVDDSISNGDGRIHPQAFYCDMRCVADFESTLLSNEYISQIKTCLICKNSSNSASPLLQRVFGRATASPYSE